MDHWPRFLEFAKLELASGGPDHHLKMAVKSMLDTDSIEERIWRAGCYMAPYEINTAAIIWEEWPYDKAASNPISFARWIEDTWPHWQLRRERRAARTVTKMTKSLVSYIGFVGQVHRDIDPGYEYLWNLADSMLIYFGRYAIIKILEALYRGEVISEPMPDIRPAGGWSPRLTLDWLYEGLPKSNKVKDLQVVNDAAADLKGKLEDFLGYQVGYFELEVLLCNYRQVLNERNGRYAGWTLDMDLEHRLKSEEWVVSEFPFYSIRKELFPKEHLGEVNGWVAPRKELCGYKGFFWSDLLYDYGRTKDYSKPVKRA